jgi:hypothetical protein
MKYKNKNYWSKIMGLLFRQRRSSIFFLNISLGAFKAAHCFNHSIMKKTVCLLFIVVMTVGCKQRTNNDIINSAAIHFAGVFITENVQSIVVLRIQGRPDVKYETDSTYNVSGSIEGFSPINYPVSIKHFNETLWYSGRNPNKRESWKCIGIYIGNKKMN